MCGKRVLLLAGVVAMAACQRSTPAVQTPRPPAAAATSGTPVIELWNGGVHLLGVKRFLLFEAFEDGTLHVRGNPALLPHTNHDGTLGVGHALPGAVRKLVAECDPAGVFDPPIKGPVLFPDGPELILIVRSRGRVAELHYHGEDPRLEAVGPNALPSRQQLQAFHRMWQRTMVGIRKLADVKIEPVVLPIPAPR